MKILNTILALIFLIVQSGCKEDLPAPDDIFVGGGDKTTVEPFDDVPAQEDMVVYEVNLRAFSNAGTISGVKSRLDHIKSLGVNVIWLMPIYPIGIEKGINSPYSISDYQDVNPEHGTLEDLILFVNEAHSMGMAVILDWVANHTAWDHPWIENKSWYTQDDNGNIVEPPGTGWADVADLNFDNQQMRAAMIEAMKFWIKDAGIDGYRCDAVDFVPADFWSEAIQQVDASTTKDLIWLGEGGASWNFTAGFEFNYGWDFYGRIKDIYSRDLSASSLFTIHNQEFNQVPSGGTKLRYITNHDVFAWDETPHEVYNDGQVGAFVATAFMPGIPLIYSGQEIGNSQLISFFNKNALNWSQNPEILAQYQTIMSIRNDLSAVTAGGLETYTNSNAILFKRTLDEEEVLVMVNTRDIAVSVTLPAELSNTSWMDEVSGQTVQLNESVTLTSYQYLILANQ